MPTHFSETVPGGSVSGTRAVERQTEGLIVEYALESTCDAPVTVRLVDRLSTENLAEYGFHEEYEPADWRLDDGELHATVTLDSAFEQTYVLGMIASNDGDLSFDAAEPELRIVDADAPTADGSTRETAVGDAVESDDGDAVAERATLQDGSVEQKQVDADGGVVNPEPDPGSVASALIAELESGTVPESQQAKLRALLGGGSESETVRLESIQKRLDDFDAYVDALEDLLSVHGNGDDAITEFDERLERLEAIVDDVEAVRQRQDELAGRLDDLSAAVDAQVETIESLQVAHQEDVDDVRTEIRRRAEVMCEEFNDLEQSVAADVATLEAEIEAFESIRRTLIDGLQRPDDTIPGTTVEDADPDALEDTQAISIVEPSDGEKPSGGGGETDAPTDSEADPSRDVSPVDEDLQESLEAAEATHFTVSSGSEQADSNGGDADGEAELGRVDDAFVSPGSVSTADDTEAASVMDDGADSVELALEAGGEDIEDEPGRDDQAEADDEATDAVDDGIEADDDGTDEADREDEDGDGASDDPPKRASSIFEIGDVDTGKSSGDEKPTIDFEDS